ncbi:methylglyoxal synthase [Inmirania thermothiophila]|uniref:Methylglyoxal synthase n=1 Tax=Inmirania thermothiophila TaxID=1750597 RepID=A0A3N1XZD0_9GAMM|nr:methylglyoxal synthase [Inmirania thermothiophila]ROR31966.1 methylglyoxal synthase [Inmirania thermothiophila]
MTAAQTVILIAHEGRLEELLKLMEKRREVFEHYRLLATSETGAAIEERLGLEVTHLFSGRKGGEIQLCGLVCTNSVRAVFFLRDPAGAAPDEPDITPFYRACDLNNVPLATNLGTAVALTQWLGRKVARGREEAAP